MADKILPAVARIVNRYATLDNNIFDLMIKYLKSSKLNEVNQDNVLQWQIEVLSKSDQLTRKTIELVAKCNKLNTKDVNATIGRMASAAALQTKHDIIVNTKANSAVVPNVDKIVDKLAGQATDKMINKNTVNLMSRNSATNTAGRIYRKIVQQTTRDTVNGSKTFEDAVRDNTIKAVAAGMPSGMVGKNGQQYSLEAYSRMVAQTTLYHTTNAVRMETMKTNNSTLALMSWHDTAREACSEIQGHIVNMVDVGDEGYDDRYDTIYAHGYGDPDGTMGINCQHEFTPWDPDVNEYREPKDMPSPDQAVSNGEVQGNQRALERSIRQSQKMANIARKVSDPAKVAHYKANQKAQEDRLTKLVDKHDFLNRDESRETIHSGGTH